MLNSFCCFTFEQSRSRSMQRRHLYRIIEKGSLPWDLPMPWGNHKIWFFSTFQNKELNWQLVKLKKRILNFAKLTFLYINCKCGADSDCSGSTFYNRCVGGQCVCGNTGAKCTTASGEAKCAKNVATQKDTTTAATATDTDAQCYVSKYFNLLYNIIVSSTNFHLNFTSINQMQTSFLLCL